MTPPLQVPHAHHCHGAGCAQQAVGIQACSRQGSPTSEEASSCQHDTLQLSPVAPAGRPRSCREAVRRRAAASCSLPLSCRLHPGDCGERAARSPCSRQCSLSSEEGGCSQPGMLQLPHARPLPSLQALTGSLPGVYRTPALQEAVRAKQ